MQKERLANKSVMRKIVTVQQKEEIISKSIFWKGDIMQDRRKKNSESKNGSFLEESNLKERLQKFVSCAKNQAILQKFV